MTLVALASAKGAPGVTTLAVGLAALSGPGPGPGGEPLLADLDPHGGDVVLRYRTADDRPLDPGVGVLSLAAAIRGNGAGTGPGPTGDLLERHCQRIAGGLPVLVGVSGPDQARGLGGFWSRLATALSAAGRPVFADVGRLGTGAEVLPVLRSADAVLLLARAELEQLAHLRERLRRLVGVAPGTGSHAGTNAGTNAGTDAELGPGAARRVGVVLVSDTRDRSVAARTEQLLRSGGLPVRVLGTVADDPRGAARLAGAGAAGRTTLVRSIRGLLPAVQELAGAPERSPDAAPAEARG